MEHKRAWIYCRVAYPDAHALAAQQANLEAYAKKQGFEIVGTTVEQASGMDFSRRGLAWPRFPMRWPLVELISCWLQTSPAWGGMQERQTLICAGWEISLSK